MTTNGQRRMTGRSVSPPTDPKISILKEAIGTLADSVEQELMQIKQAIIPGVESRLHLQLMESQEQQKTQMETSLRKFQKQIELSQETDVLRYQLWLKEQGNNSQQNMSSILMQQQIANASDSGSKIVQDYCKPLFETLKQMLATSTKQVYALSEQVQAMEAKSNAVGQATNKVDTMMSIVKEDLSSMYADLEKQIHQVKSRGLVTESSEKLEA